MIDQDFTDYMGFRNMVIEDEIEHQLGNGGDDIDIDSGDYTEDEIDYIEEQVRRRR